MAKTRRHIPRDVKDKVLSEFNHRCAICGSDNPQLHHIDEDPSNFDPLNLIPLCPNCHLTDQHSPTKSLEPSRLRLFREYKDPTILKPQFHPLFSRLQFLDSIGDDTDIGGLRQQADELVAFVAELEMGNFYSKKIRELTRDYPPAGVVGDPEAEHQYRLKKRKWEETYRERLRRVRDEVYSLAVELLRFQPW
jgi:hypothetical protein